MDEQSFPPITDPTVTTCVQLKVVPTTVEFKGTLEDVPLHITTLDAEPTGLSLIVTLKEQVEVPHELVAVQVTTVVPLVKVEPDAGEQTTVPPLVAVGFVQVATWLLHCVIFEGHAPITGALLICTLNVHDELPQVLVAVQVTVLSPAANVLPDAGEQVTVAAG